MGDLPSLPFPAPSIGSSHRFANQLPGHISARPLTKIPFVREPCVPFPTRSVKSERERAKIIEVFAFEPTVACALIKPTCALILNGYIGIWVNTLLKIGIRQTVSQD